MTRRDTQRRRFGPLASALLMLLVSMGGAVGAQEDSPMFFIEKITVEAPRLSPEIVLSESLLREGRTYTEDDLREAVHRINRLPFVLLAEFSLRKGSERGRFELVIQIYETRRWFFQVGGEWELNDPLGTDPFDPRVGGLLDDRIGDTTDEVRSLVGRRFAVGRRGLLFASFGTEDGAFAVGYQRYNLWNRNILLSVSVGGEDEFGDVIFSGDTLAARVQLGIPIKGNHALRLLAATRDSEVVSAQRFGLEVRETEAEVAWIFNSLDDPVLPREGTLYEVGLAWTDERDTQFLLIGNTIRRFDFSEERTGVFGSAGRHFPLGQRQSISASLRGFLTDGPQNEVQEVEASLGHQVFLLRRLELDKWRELRLETQISAARQDFSIARSLEDVGFSDAIVESWKVRTGLTYRNGWGLFRLFLSYLDREVR
ncbi:MAG: hypothetical protein ACE5GX_00285 [Thermoanaerobaculia bacterium]